MGVVLGGGIVAGEIHPEDQIREGPDHFAPAQLLAGLGDLPHEGHRTPVPLPDWLLVLIRKAIEKERQFPGCIDVEKVRNCTDFQTYDTEVTARLHGFRDARHYWEEVGCGQFLADIRVPTMLLTAEDDAFNPAHTIPREIADASDYLVPQWTRHGGHGGFVSGAWPWEARYWMDEQVVRFFAALEDGA